MVKRPRSGTNHERCLSFGYLTGSLPHACPAIVYTHHSPIDIRGVSRMSAQYNKLHDSLALRADRIVASSQHYASQHRSRYGPLVQSYSLGSRRAIVSTVPGTWRIR